MVPTVLELIRTAELFRSVGQSISDAGVFSYMGSYPEGWCGTMSRAWGAYLCEEYPEVEFQFVCGWRNGRSHAWIQMDEFILDVTADQFDDCSEQIIVSANSAFHKSFEIDPNNGHILSTKDKDYPEERKIYFEAKRMTAMEQKATE